MGSLNCNVQCHYYLKTEYSFFKNLAKENESEKNEINELNTEVLINKKDIDYFSEFFKNSIYPNLINEKILSYIKNNKLNYKSYIISFSSLFKSNPIEFPNGNVFFGNLDSNHEIDGYGLYILTAKNIITEGIWEKGNIIFGRIFFQNDDIYEGKLTKTIPNGKGTFIFGNGEIYKGDFIFGEMTGKGTYIFDDKTYYCGDFTKGTFNGEGSMKWPNGVEYHGNFSDSSLNNKGKIFNDLLYEKYIGNFENNEFNGNGTYKYKNGDVYEGNFENSIRKGIGNYKIKNGIEFTGNWDRDLPNGEGIIFCDKFKIKGKWKDGVKVEILEVLERDKKSKDIKKIDLNIKTCEGKIKPGSLQHLCMNS